MADFDRSVFWPAFLAAGFLVPVRVTTTDSPPATADANVEWIEPDTVSMTGSLSKDYAIKYQRDDLPELAEGHLVDRLDANGDVISGQQYRVRQTPQVTDNPADDQSGFFRVAVLTKL